MQFGFCIHIKYTLISRKVFFKIQMVASICRNTMQNTRRILEVIGASWRRIVFIYTDQNKWYFNMHYNF